MILEYLLYDYHEVYCNCFKKYPFANLILFVITFLKSVVLHSYWSIYHRITMIYYNCFEMFPPANLILFVFTFPLSVNSVATRGRRGCWFSVETTEQG